MSINILIEIEQVNLQQRLDEVKGRARSDTRDTVHWPFGQAMHTDCVDSGNGALASPEVDIGRRIPQ